MNKTCYKAFGLQLFSEIPLPELTGGIVEKNKADVIVKLEDLSATWSMVDKKDIYFYVTDSVSMFEIPNVAIFKVENGNKIMVSPINKYRIDQIRLYLLGTCMGIILMQRKILPLHGSAVEINGKAYAIVGESGAGKSTLASALIKKGYRLLSDDVIPVTLKDKSPIITPAYPQQKLWVESLNEFGMESDQYRPIVERERKFAIPVQENFASESVPLHGIFELVKGEENLIQIHPIQQLPSLYTLYQHTYRNFLISRMGLMDWHFQTTTQIASSSCLYQITRPKDYFTAYELADLLLQHVAKGE